MLNLQPNEITFIEKTFVNSIELINATHVNIVLDAIGNWIDDNGFDENYDLTDEGRIAQRIYDNIYMNNEG